MSQLLINDYLKQHDLVFLAEYPCKTATKTNVIVDDALPHEPRMPLGYWEAEDKSDDLEEEIVKKSRKRNPRTRPSARNSIPAASPITGKKSPTCCCA